MTRIIKSNLRYYQRDILITTLFLCVLGLLMIFSASGSVVYFKRQLIFVAAGFAVCFVVQYLDYRILYRYAKYIFLISILCVFLLKTPAGVTVNGATRWLKIAGIQFQVAEVVKIGVIIILGNMIKKHRRSLDRIKLLIQMWLLGGGAAGLLLIISNDLSSSIVVLGITFCMTFVFISQPWIHLAAIGSVGGAAVIYVMSIWKNMPEPKELEQMSFRVGRIAAWLDPYRYEANQGYQTLQALYAIGRGGLVGKFLGNSLQKFMIPEPHTDMIFAILCEELGLTGAVVLFILLSFLIYCLIQTSIMTDDLFGSAITTGVAAHIAVQSLINLSVSLNLLPNTGIALPFISYGGTAVFTLLCEIALVLSVSRIANGLQVFRWSKSKQRLKNNKQKIRRKRRDA